MTLNTTDISSIIFESKAGSDFLTKINQLIAGLIHNDLALAQGNEYAPGIWECKWLNDDTIKGYSKGDAVWINVFTYEQVLALNYDHIYSQVVENPTLNARFSYVNKNDQDAVNAFLLKAMKGNVPGASNVSAMYRLGELNNSVQIMVSKTDNNKTYPYIANSADWGVFYSRSTMDQNKALMLQTLSSQLSTQFDEHLEEYHPVGLTKDRLNEMNFFERSQLLNDAEMQHFYDHDYCRLMQGCDYVRSFTYDSTAKTWCRVWNSGYIEQGGFVTNNGQRLIRVNFKQPYNYPVGPAFYQYGYNQIPDKENNKYVGISASVPSTNRYMFTITPIMRDDNSAPYSSVPLNSSYVNMYASVDATDIDNNGFSIVNLNVGDDVSKLKYEKYSWSASGYSILN